MKTQAPFLLALLLWLLGFSGSKAQEMSLPFRHYGVDEGLANADVYDILKDKKGFLWLATDNGLSRFDGLRFKNYYIQNGLAHNSLTALAQRQDTLYVACYRKGVQRMVAGVLEKTLFNTNHSVAFIYASKANVYMPRQANTLTQRQLIFVNKETNLDFETNRVLYAANRSRQRPFFYLSADKQNLYCNGVFYRHLPPLLSKQILYGIDQTPTGELLFGSVGQYFILSKNNALTVVRSPALATFKKIDIIFKDQQGRVWYRDQYGRAVVEINGTAHDINQLLKIEENVAIRNIFYDEDTHYVWIATGGKGIYCIYNDFIQNFSLDNANMGSKITTLETDYQQRLWVGGLKGFSVFEGSRFVAFKNPNGWKLGVKMQKNCGSLLLSYGNADNSRAILSQTQWQGQNMVSSVFSVAIDCNLILNRELWQLERRNKQWYYRGTNQRPNSTRSEIYRKKWVRQLVRPNRRIFSLFHRNDTTWLGSNKELSWLLWSKNKKMAVEKAAFPQSAVLNSVISEIKADRSGRVFVLSDKGMAIWHAGRLVFEGAIYQNQPVVGVLCLEFDAKNRMWLGTRNGLWLLDGKKWVVFNQKNGLINSEINALKFEETAQKLWIGTNDGLASIDIKAFDRHVFAPPLLEISHVSTFDGQRFSTINDLQFATDQNYLQFHLRVNNLVGASTASYEYALEGKNWTPTDSVLTLPALSAGRYLLSFRAKNDNSIWSKPRLLRFEVKLPFYQNWTFGLLVSLLLIGGVYWGFELVRRRQAAQLKINRQIAELTARISRYAKSAFYF